MHFTLTALVYAVLATSVSFVLAAPTPSDEPTIIHGFTPVEENPLVPRLSYLDYSGVACRTECSGTAGRGPNEWDCLQLVYKYWGYGTYKFHLDPNTVTVEEWGSCKVEFHNLSNVKNFYQYNLMGTVVDWLRQRCNAAHGAAVGKCIFSDNLPQSPWIEVTHS